MILKRVLLSLILMTSGLVVFAQSMEQLKKNKEALDRQIELAQRNLNKAVSGKKLTLGQINTIKSQVRLMQSKISTINSEMKTLDNQITENTGKVHNLQNRLVDLKKEYAGMIRFAQRNRNSYDKMMFIFASSDFNQAYKRIKYLQQFGQYRKKQAAYIQGTEKELNTKISVLDQNLKSKNNLLKEQVTEKGKLDKKKNEQSAVLNQFSKQERQLSQDIQKKRREQDAINRKIRAEIQRIVALERKKEEDRLKEEARVAAAKAKAENRPVPTAPVAKAKTDSELLRATPEAAKLSDAFESNRGSLPAPVANGFISQRFGSYKVDQANNNNDGVTFQTSEGSTVRAAFNGTVSNVWPMMGRFIVMIRHGEYSTIYQNLKSVNVSENQKVTTKQSIGTAGLNDGIPEVGFCVLKGGAFVNPESWLAK
ncbi:MAG: peptidase M23 [Pedobacter sp.]|nr:MAG: peptidase M23 [Pedobacter sp.]